MKTFRKRQNSSLRLALMLLPILLGIGSARAATYTVNTTADPGDGTCDAAECTLREAMAAANANAGPDTIDFSVTGTINLTGVLPDITDDLTINGPGAKLLTVRRDTGGDYRIFTVVTTGVVTFSGLTISNGSANSLGFPDGSGGGILNSGGTVSAIGCTISGNSASIDGGGIFSDGKLNVIGSAISDNTAAGSGIFHGGGGIINEGRTTITNSSISRNSASIGGGIHNLSNLEIDNTTIGGNVATGTTITGGGINNNAGGLITIESSIVALNEAPNAPEGVGSNLWGSYTSQGHNVVGTTSGSYIAPETSDQFDVAADQLKLGPLQDNGGPTQTMALGCGSVAIDHGIANSLTTDQRGANFARTVDFLNLQNAVDGDGADVGAFEIQDPVPCNQTPTAVDDGYSINEDTTLTVAAPAGSVLSNDTDPDAGDSLRAVLVTNPSNAASFAFNADGSFSYTPATNFNGSDSFTYKARDLYNADSNVATVTITVAAVNDPPAVSAAPKTQTGVQYSDPIAPVIILASDPDTAASALTFTYSFSKDGLPPVAGLPAGFLITDNGVSDGVRRWTVSGAAQAAAGTYVVSFGVTDTGGSSNLEPPSTASDTFAIVVVAENAVAAPQAGNPVSMQVSSPGGTASGTTAPICFDTAEPADGSPGNTSLIDLSAVSLQIDPTGDSGAPTISPTSFNFMGGGVGAARSVCFALSLLNTPVNVYQIKLVIGGSYYTGMGTTTFTVFDPSTYRADLLVGLGVNNIAPKQGDLITYTMTVRNFGPNVALNTVLNDVLSSGTTFYSARANRGHFTAPPSGQTGTVTWYVGDVANNGQESAQIDVTVIVKGKTTITNTASASSDTTDPNVANNSASITVSVAAGSGGGKKN